MKPIHINQLPLKKIEDKQGLYHMDVVDAGTGAKNFTFHFAKMEPGGLGSLHSHPHSEHMLVVVEGELEVRNSQEKHRIPQGSAILILPGEEHEIANVHAGDSRYYVVYAPPR